MFAPTPFPKLFPRVGGGRQFPQIFEEIKQASGKAGVSGGLPPLTASEGIGDGLEGGYARPSRCRRKNSDIVDDLPGSGHDARPSLHPISDSRRK